MRHNKFFTSAIVVCIIALFTMGWVPSPTSAPNKTPITINSSYEFSSYPFPGTFYTHGALEIQGTVTMEVDFNSNGTRAHCLYTFVAPGGTFTVKEQCVFATSPAQGRWEIVSGTGDYANLKGNGSALMPGNEENWEGFIY